MLLSVASLYMMPASADDFDESIIYHGMTGKQLNGLLDRATDLFPQNSELQIFYVEIELEAIAHNALQTHNTSQQINSLNPE